MSVSKVRQLANTDPNGTTLLGIVDAATVLGFDAKGIKTGSPDNISLPAIVHVIVDRQISHYVILLDVTSDKVTIMDPASGKITRFKKEDFEKVWTGIAVQLSPGGQFIESKSDSTLKKISMLVVPLKSSLAWASVCAAIVSVLGISISIYVREVVDVILVRKSARLLSIVSTIAIAVMLMQGILTIIKGRIVLMTGRILNDRLIISYYRHIFRLPQSFLDKMRVGEMLSRVNDAVKITSFIHEIAVNLLVDGLIVVFSIGAMFYFNWRIGLLVSAVVPVYCLIYLISNRINSRWQRKIAIAGADVDASLVETFGAVRTIRNLALESYFSQKVSLKLKRLLENVYQASSKQLNVQAGADLLSKIFIVLLLWTGSYYVMSDSMTTGELMLFYTLLTWFTVPLIYLLGANKIYNEATISAERLFDILDLEVERNGFRKVDRDKLSIRFNDVWFAYAYSDFVLKGVNLIVEKGMVLGISGRSGCGKSTLASLLLRNYEPSFGSIIINDVDICDIERESICETIGLVSQKTELFSATVKENITVGMQLDEERLNSICEKLGIMEFSSLHPAGLDMMITEYGNNLSGGQKQRIAIARAIYRNTPLLILDEATAAIDAWSEEKIMQTIEWYKNSGNTVIIIAHSESTLKICNNIVILDDGVIK